MFDNEIKRYRLLNELAGQGGTVIIGGAEDTEIPLCELKQAFALESDLYNRSAANLSISNAVEFYDSCAADLHPESVYLHIGSADLEAFEQAPAAFDQKYRELIRHIRNIDKACEIAVISLKNPEKRPIIAEMNRHLRVIAQSEKCEFGDIAANRVWNPKETRDVVSFIHSIGFMHPLRSKRPLYDMIKILFCYEPAHIA